VELFETATDAVTALDVVFVAMIESTLLTFNVDGVIPVNAVVP
jgi:hypothetical protein